MPNKKPTANYTLIDAGVIPNVKAARKRGRPPVVKKAMDIKKVQKQLKTVEDCKHTTSHGGCSHPRHSGCSYMCPWRTESRSKCKLYKAEMKAFAAKTFDVKNRTVLMTQACLNKDGRADWTCPECRETEFAYLTKNDEKISRDTQWMHHVCKWCRKVIALVMTDERYYEIANPGEYKRIQETNGD